MRLVYVAGPYTSDPQGNTERAMDVGDAVEDLGYAVFIPHLSHFRHLRRPRDYEHWMAVDLAWLEMCDAMFLIPGKSSGAEREVAFAREHMIPVFTDMAEMDGWLKGADAASERARAGSAA